MGFFRNPEVKRTCIFYLGFTIVFTCAACWFGNHTGNLEYSSSRDQQGFLFAGFVFLVSMVFFGSYLFITNSRYQKIKRLSMELDEMLHSNKLIAFSQYREGELSILESELSKMTRRLVEQAENLKQDKSYLSDAMADISHQLRSPLTASQLILSLLKEPDLEPERKRELLQEQTQLLSHMGWLVETMLKMAKMDAKTAFLVKEQISLQELLKESLEPVLIPMELREIECRIQGVTEEMSFVGDKAWCREAVLNIVKNCMEHTKGGGYVEIQCRDTPLYLEIVITDNGEGICPEDLPYLFDRFYKGQNAAGCSVGIGLALARMIITEMNGTIKAENRREGGAKFSIRFYRQKTM